MHNKSHRCRSRRRCRSIHKRSKKHTKNNRYKRRYNGGTLSLTDNYNQLNSIFKTQPLSLPGQPFMQ